MDRTEWDSKVPGCFGGSELNFASHPLYEDRAFAWLTELRKHGIGWRAARQQLEAYLASEGASAEHVSRQIESARKKLKPWLLD